MSGMLTAFLALYGVVATYGWVHCNMAAKSWRRAFMAERGCQVKD